MMINMEEKIRDKLEKEAAQWVEEELEKRMGYARDAIDCQVNVSADMCGECGANKHIREASALAEEVFPRSSNSRQTGGLKAS